jgi:hypothetical protein
MPSALNNIYFYTKEVVFKDVSMCEAFNFSEIGAQRRGSAYFSLKK